MGLIFCLGCHHESDAKVRPEAGASSDTRKLDDGAWPLADVPSETPPPPATVQSTHLLGVGWGMPGAGIAIDPAGSVLLVGDTPSTKETKTDLLVAKVQPDGSKVWTREFGGPLGEMGRGVATDQEGNVIAVGGTFNALDDNVKAGGEDAFVTKLDTAGTRLWTRQYGSAMLDQANAVATDPTGNIFVAGVTYGAIGDTPSSGDGDAFVVKLDAKGTTLWIRQFGSPAWDGVLALACDPTGNVTVVGYTDGGFGGHKSAGAEDIFVAKLDVNGETLWTRQFGTAGDDNPNAAATDSSGNLYLVGNTQGGLDGNARFGADDAFVTKLGPNGDTLWTRQWGCAESDNARAVAVDRLGDVYVAGESWGNPDGWVNAGAKDMFLLKYDSNGVEKGSLLKGSVGDEDVIGMAIDQKGTITVAGYTTGELDGIPNPDKMDWFLCQFVEGQAPK
jgi:hypothetical protein